MCVLPGIPRHVTQRGVDRRETFSADTDRETYLRLLRENLAAAQARVLGWRLMTNHVHLALVPEREKSLSLMQNATTGKDRPPVGGSGWVSRGPIPYRERY